MRLGVAPGFIQITAPVIFGYREHAVSAMKDLKKTLAGVWHAIHAEKEGSYPGGASRALERWRVLTRQLRPVSIDCLHQDMHDEAWKLYRASFKWNLNLGRWKYLLGFPLKALLKRS